MAISLSQLNADLGYIIDDMPTTFIWAGSSYTGVFDPIAIDRMAEIGGYVNDFQGTLYARQSAFGTLPSAGITISIGTTTYRVDNIKKSPDNVQVMMELITPDK